jgi:xanthine dehydrogenase accessory factor
MSMEKIYPSIYRYLKNGRRTVLSRIIRQSGSAPRSLGAQCLVTEDCVLTGTIGGGRLEHEVLSRAKEIFQDGQSAILSFQMTGVEVAESDMLCGGSVEVYLEPIFPENEMALQLFNQLSTLIDHGHSGTLITRISQGVNAADTTSRMLIGPDENITGDLAGNSTDWNKWLPPITKIREATLMETEKKGATYFVEPIRPEDVVVLFGAGHVSRYVAALSETVGFSVVVVDDRKEFANKERFPHAKIVVTPFLASFDQRHINTSAYVVIVTRGHTHDRDVLRQVLNQSAAYVGMIGSRRKRNIIYQSLKDDGVSDNQLDRVHSPIGLSIGAQTPEEIAVSIVAELIEVRASRKKPGGNDQLKTDTL